MKPALLLVDMQRDFLQRKGLIPSASELITRTATLLSEWRVLGLPVLHTHTLVRQDGSDRMPHWKQSDAWICTEGSPGAQPPPALTPLPEERVFAKQFYSAFANPGLEEVLKALEVETLIIVGIYLHGCIRASVMDAYEKGYRVWVAQDAVGSTEPLHAEITRNYLDGRSATFMPTDTILKRLRGPQSGHESTTPPLPVGCIDGLWQDAPDGQRLNHRNPSDLERMNACVPVAGPHEVAKAVTASKDAFTEWSRTGHDSRTALLQQWKQVLQRNSETLTTLMAEEIGKPITDAREEYQRALAHIDNTIRTAATTRPVARQVSVRYRPVGCIGLITPWNNPLAIAIGKIAPALAFGNSVVWKPSPRAARISMSIMTSIIRAGLSPGVVNLVFGDADTARLLMREPGIDAVSLTGSVAAGQTASALCALSRKPLQAELGGNNSLIVLDDADLEQEAEGMALSAFSSAGQRCTAIRRFIVERSILDTFEQTLSAAVKAMRLGDPLREETQIGPLVSAEHLERVQTSIKQAIADGGRLLCGGQRPAELQQGCWLQPTLIGIDNHKAPIVQHETFGPVAVILAAGDIEQAIALANDVPQGLVAGILSSNPAARKRFTEDIETGILKMTPGPLAIHSNAPFGGWKTSRIGPPEHGIWDRDFYTRPQAIYGEIQTP